MFPRCLSDSSSYPESQISPQTVAGTQRCAVTSSPATDEPAKKAIVLPKRQKRFAAKVKTGCMTCRRRHIKCDEGKPSCKKCTSAGRDCQYPPLVFRFTANQSVENASAPPQKPLNIRPKVSIAPQGMRVDRQEAHVFDLFRLRTAHQVGGSFNQAFWTGDVLRATSVYPAVWHACLSFAALDHRAKKPKAPEADKNSLYAFALLQHNASIRHMVKIAQQASPSYADQEAFMLVSMLYTGLCCLQGDVAQAAEHARTSILLFYQWRFWEHQQQGRRDHILSPGALISLISLYESQIFGRIRDVPRPNWYLESTLPTGPSEPYQSMSEAFVDIQPMLTAIFQAFPMVTLPGDISKITDYDDRVRQYKNRFTVWRLKFNALLDTRPDDSSTKRGAIQLQLMEVAVYVCLHLDRSLGEESFDHFTESFARINNLSRQLIHLEREAEARQGIDGQGFSYSVSVAELLFGVGRTCRDRLIRREAVALLRQWPRRDGVWRPIVVAAMCAAIIELEEGTWYHARSIEPDKCSCVYEELICNNHRVGRLELRMSAPGQASVYFRTVSDVRHQRNGLTKTISIGEAPTR
ncbi:dihydrolipoyl dehydrogenase [Cordyceps javanica]|nr:dihydrolipoyl dehydrogenase [Cordyceps javanica]